MNITKTSATGAMIAAAGAVARVRRPAANAAVFPNNPVNVTQCYYRTATPSQECRTPLVQREVELGQVRGAVPGQSQPLLQHDRPHHR